MQNKKKHLIKGIMLSTVLGLGWSVAGDISHAAGNGLSQIAEIQEWNAEKAYNKGETVTYNGGQYEAQIDTQGDQPDESSEWKWVEGEIPKWSEKKLYYPGQIVTYNGIQYKTKSVTVRDRPGKISIWKPWNLAITEWNSKTEYVVGQIVTYNGIQYEALFPTQGDQPDQPGKPGKPPWLWLPLNEGQSEETLEKEEVAYKVKGTSRIIEYPEIKYKVKTFNDKGVTVNKYFKTIDKNKTLWQLVQNKEEIDALIALEKKEASDMNVGKAINETTPQWNEKTTYGVNDKVVYQGTEYQLTWGQTTKNPNHYIHWKAIGGKTPEWAATRGYLEGDKVVYNGAVYEATKQNGGGMQPDQPNAGWKKTGESAPQTKNNPAVSNTMVKNVLEWDADELYFAGDIVKYEGIQYEALGASVDEVPGASDKYWKMK